MPNRRIKLISLWYLDISWTWRHGSKSADQVQTSSGPGGRSGAVSISSGENMWLFGGKQHDEPNLKSDFWKLNVQSFTWEMIHNGSSSSPGGSPSPRQFPIGCNLRFGYMVLFGGLGQDGKALGDTWIFYFREHSWYTLDAFRKKVKARSDADGGKTPPARGDAAVWCSHDQKMIMFGGIGAENQLLHDMWTFDMAELSWAEQESSARIPADPDFVKFLSYPRGRSGAVTWVTEDHMYMFGGSIASSGQPSMHSNNKNSGDLWMYHFHEDEWVYISGHRDVCSEPGQYGKLGVAKPTNQPGCRRQSAAWVDRLQNLWMFGGEGVDSSMDSLSAKSHSRLLSDVWYFDTKNKMWIWKGGKMNGDKKGSFGKIGESGSEFLPGARCEMAVWSTWRYFYLFGGLGHDGNGVDGYLGDVWEIDVYLDPSVQRNTPSAGPVIGILLLGFGLAAVVSVLYFLSRGSYKSDQSRKIGSKYMPVSQETELA